MVAVPGPLLSNTMLDNERGPGTANITRHFSATHLIYVQRSFWAQLVETAEDPFKYIHNFYLARQIIDNPEAEFGNGIGHLRNDVILREPAMDADLSVLV